MSFTITTENRKQYLYIKSIGNVNNADELFLHSQSIYESILKYKSEKILIDGSLTTFPKEMSVYYEVVQRYAQYPNEIKRLKIACIASLEQFQMGKFWETVCVNRGYPYYMFYTFQEAEQWLLS